MESDKQVGMSFPCFVSGDMLYITGTAENLQGQAAHALMPRVSLVTRVMVQALVLIRADLQVGLETSEQLSPYNPPVRYLASELAQRGIVGSSFSETITAQLVETDQVCPEVVRFSVKLGRAIEFVPGSHIVLDWSQHFDTDYKHMNDSDPQALNDDYIRALTISGWTKATMDRDRGTVSTESVQCMMKLKPSGAVSSLVQRVAEGSQSLIPLPIRVAGIECDFQHYDAPMLWIAAGIGITPFIAMHASLDSGCVDVVMLYCCRGADLLLLNQLLPAAQGVQLTVFTSKPSCTPLDEEVNIVARRIRQEDVAAVSNLKGRMVSVCGPAGLSADVLDWLQALGVTDSNINCEHFSY